MKIFRSRLLALALLPWAAAIPVAGAEVVLAIKAFTDTTELPTEKRAKESLEFLLPQLNMDGEVMDLDSPAATGAGANGSANQLPPAVTAQLKPMYEKSIADMEAQLAKMDPEKQADSRKAIEAALARTRKTYAEMFGGAVPTAAAAPAAPSKKVLRRPVIGNRIPSFPETRANLKKMLKDNASAEALAAFAADPIYQDATRVAASAAGAVMIHRPVAALAALLRAQELQPKEPAHLVNLAGLVTNLGMPRHALALLAEAEKLGKPLPVAFGISGRALLLSNRGHALIQLKRYAEAETVLREAVRLAPTLSEARANLAHALYPQADPKKKEEAITLLRFSARRSIAAQKASAPATTGPAAPGTPAPGDQDSDDEDATPAATAQAGGRPPPEAVLDMSRGKSGGLPTIKIPRTIMDGAAMWPKVKKFQDENRARGETITKRMIALDKLMRQRERSGEISPATARRARDIFWYIGNTPRTPQFRGLWREMEKASRAEGNGLTGGQIDNPWGSLELMKKQDEIFARTQPPPVTAAQMWDATEPYHESWQAPIHWIESANNQYFHKTYPYMTAIAANLYDPMYHEYAMLLIENISVSLTQGLIGPLYTVTKHDYYFVKAWGARGKEGEAADPIPGDMPEADSCPAYLRGEYKMKFDIEIVGFSINCEKVSVEGSLGEWLKLFGEVETTFAGETTVFVGGAAEGEVPLVGGVEAGAKAGAYLTFNSKGEIIDGGLKATESSGVSVGPVGYEREIEHTYSLAAAFQEL